jgi:uncharacterized protein (TIGR04255 family)
MAYPKSPIVEAIIEVMVAPQPGTQLENLNGICAKIATEYPVKGDLKRLHGLQLQAGVFAEEVYGYMLTSGDQKNLVQIRLDGFRYSVLAPYKDWEAFSGQAGVLWNLYQKEIGPAIPLSVSLRYVNRINLPLPIRDLRDFIRTYPEISSDMDQHIAGFFMQLQSHQADLQAVATIGEGMVIPPPSPDVVSILLDITLSRSTNLPSDAETLWSVLESFRTRKNVIFEACITNRTREFFK